MVSVNIIADRGADPWVSLLENGEYLYCKSGNEDTEIRVAVSDSLQSIGSGVLNIIASEHNLPEEASKQIWAPEEHDGIIYFAASNGKNEKHRMHALKRLTKDPIGEYEYAGKLSVEDDKWAIDGTVLNIGDQSYFIWSGWEGDENGQQNLYIARMTSPTTLDKNRTCISVPTHEWEKQVMPINEGPAVLHHGDDISLTFSASASWTDNYCIGLMKLTGTNPLDRESWVKYEEPLYSSSDEEFGPGHCSFTKDEHGNDIMVYHTARVSGAGWDRQIRYVQIIWKDGRPYVKPSRDHLLLHAD